ELTEVRHRFVERASAGRDARAALGGGRGDDQRDRNGNPLATHRGGAELEPGRGHHVVVRRAGGHLLPLAAVHRFAADEYHDAVGDPRRNCALRRDRAVEAFTSGPNCQAGETRAGECVINQRSTVSTPATTQPLESIAPRLIVNLPRHWPAQTDLLTWCQTMTPGTA